MSIAFSSITDDLTFLHELDGDQDNDLNLPESASLAIIGRNREFELLIQAYNKLIQTKERQTVCLHGYSGSGKTALVEHFRESLFSSEDEDVHPYFCSGKYFQKTIVHEPYSAIASAFSDLCDVVVQSRQFTKERQLQMSKDLASDAHVLAKMISNFQPFVAGNIFPERQKVHDSEDYQTEGIVARFKIAYKAFLRTMTSGSKPVVVFLDDIQWMDEGSQHLLEMYLTDAELRNVLFVLSYREEEKGVADMILCNINQEEFVDIAIENLRTNDVTALISLLMKAPQSVPTDLSNLVVQKTGGNPFHILQFMDAIEREELLLFDPESSCWVYNVELIQREMMVADTLADLLLRKIQTLPKTTQKILAIAALLGFHFQEDFLTTVVCSQPECVMSLEKGVDSGILERTHDGFIFSHDKLQSAFQEMLSRLEVKQLHLKIGTAYLKRKDDEASMYYAAVHLNEAVDLILDPGQRLMLARTNLEAYNYCNDKAAFDTAAIMLRKGLNLLEEEDKWTMHFDLVFKMTESLAKTELTVGNLDQCKELTRQTLQRATSLDMKVNSLLIDLECQMKGMEMADSIHTAFRALRILGISMPKKISNLHLLSKLLRIRRILRHKTDESILQLPHIQDRTTAVAVRILHNIGFYCMLQDAKLPSVYVSLVALELTLRHGISQHGADALVMYALIELRFNNFDRAQRLGNLGMKIIDRLENKESECMATCLWVAFLAYWKLPLQVFRQRILGAIDSGFACGDPIYTPLAVANEHSASINLGEHLKDVEAFMRASYSRLKDSSRDTMLLWVQPSFQTVLNLQCEDCTDWKALTVLSGEIMDEKHFFEQVAITKHNVLFVVGCTMKAQLSYLFGFTAQAHDLYEKMVDTGKIVYNSYSVLSWFFFGSLINYERYRETGKYKHLKTARKWQRSLLDVQSRGCPNVSRVVILRAEEMSVRKSATVASITAAYDHAIDVMQQDKFVHMEALANERAGFVLAQRLGGGGDAVLIRRYFERAIYLWRYGWGSKPKAEWVEEKMFQVLALAPHNNQGADMLSGSPNIGDVIHVSDELDDS